MLILWSTFLRVSQIKHTIHHTSRAHSAFWSEAIGLQCRRIKFASRQLIIHWDIKQIYCIPLLNPSTPPWLNVITGATDHHSTSLSPSQPDEGFFFFFYSFSSHFSLQGLRAQKAGVTGPGVVVGFFNGDWLTRTPAHTLLMTPIMPPRSLEWWSDGELLVLSCLPTFSWLLTESEKAGEKRWERCMPKCCTFKHTIRFLQWIKSRPVSRPGCILMDLKLTFYTAHTQWVQCGCNTPTVCYFSAPAMLSGAYIGALCIARLK